MAVFQCCSLGAGIVFSFSSFEESSVTCALFFGLQLGQVVFDLGPQLTEALAMQLLSRSLQFRCFSAAGVGMLKLHPKLESPWSHGAVGTSLGAVLSQRFGRLSVLNRVRRCDIVRWPARRIRGWTARVCCGN